MASIFRNFSYTMTVKKAAQPSRLLAASLIEVYGDINSKQQGDLIEARCEVGPLPIERPNRMTSFYGMPTQRVR